MKTYGLLEYFKMNLSLEHLDLLPSLVDTVTAMVPITIKVSTAIFGPRLSIVVGTLGEGD